MKNLKSLFCFSFIFIILITFVSCKGKTINEDADIESIFPEESSLVFVIDTHDRNQLNNLNPFKDFFEENSEEKLEIFEHLFRYHFLAKINTFSYQEELKTILEEPFRMGIAITKDSLEDNLNKKNNQKTADAIEDINEKYSLREEPSVLIPERTVEKKYIIQKEINISTEELPSLMEDFLYFAIKSKKADEIFNLLTDFLTKDESFYFEEKKDIKYWRSTKKEGAIVQYGEIIFVTGTDKGVEEAINRLKEKTVFFERDFSINSLVYFYIKDISHLAEDTNDFNSLFFSKFSPPAWFYIIFEDSGIRVKNFSNTKSNYYSNITTTFADYDFDLASRVYGDKVFFYIENVNFFNEIEGEFFDSIVLESGLKDFFDDDGYGPITKNLLSSPFAFSVSALGEVLPTIGFYLLLGEEKANDAQKIVNVFDEYIGEIVDEFDKIMELENLDLKMLKKEKIPLRGAVLNKISFNIDNYLENHGDFFGIKENLFQREEVSIYYGLTHDNVFILFFGEKFEKTYGKNVLSENPNFIKVFKNMPKAETSLTYFNFVLFSDFLEKTLKVVDQNLGAQGYITNRYESFFKPVMAPLKFFVDISKNPKTDGHTEYFLAIE